MNYKNELLIKSAARLYSLGVDLEAARERLRELVEKGVPYDSDEMLTAYHEFSELDRLWKSLEKQHLDLRDEIIREGRAK